MRKTSGPDRNDKLMKRAGFKRCPHLDAPKFNVHGDITYWVNEFGIRVVTDKSRALSLRELLTRVMNQSARKTRERIKRKISNIEYGVEGFIYEEDEP